MSDWIRKIPSWDWHAISLRGYPGWDTANGHPHFIKTRHVSGKKPSSHELASSFDDVAQHAFYTRDWTESGIPIVRRGEAYWSGWWFQRVSDFERFIGHAAAAGVEICDEESA